MSKRVLFKFNCGALSKLLPTNFPKIDKTLTIHGFDLEYSKYGYQSAEMRYLQISANDKDKVDVIIPNGYEIAGNDNKDYEKAKNTHLGFLYKQQTKMTLQAKLNTQQQRVMLK